MSGESMNYITYNWNQKSCGWELTVEHKHISEGEHTRAVDKLKEEAINNLLELKL